MPTIVDYGSGNLRSVQKAFERLGQAATVTSDPAAVAAAERLVLPGVGAFGDAMRELRSRGLVEPIVAHLRADRPFFGICMGLQLLFETGLEGGRHAGLGVLPGDVVRVRTDFRGETVRRYRLEGRPENLRILLERFAIESSELAHAPRWYNAVTQSCGVDILRTAWGQRIPLIPSPKLLLNGTWERDAWEEGRMGAGLGFEDALQRADITADARAADILSARFRCDYARPVQRMTGCAGGAGSRRSVRTRRGSRDGAATWITMSFSSDF